MTPGEVGARLAGLLGDEGSAASVVEEFGQATLDVPADLWVAAVTAARDDPQVATTFFDWLSAVDLEDDGFAVVVHLWSTAYRHHAFVRTTVPRARPRLASITPVFPGAAWHERETHEMFGIVFDGHPGLAPLLLPEGFEGHPLRKEFVLASRVAKEWPGAPEPGESHREGIPKRSRMRPPGVPEPGTWAGRAAGDRAGGEE